MSGQTGNARRRAAGGARRPQQQRGGAGRRPAGAQAHGGVRRAQAPSQRAAAGARPSQQPRRPHQAQRAADAQRPEAQQAATQSPPKRGRVRGIGSTRMKDRARLSERMNLQTRTKLFLQSTAFDFLLVLVVVVALSFTVSYGFNSAAALRGNVALIVGMTLPLLVALYVGTWSKKALIPSVIATVGICVVEIVVAGAVSPEPMFTDAGVSDTQGNYVIFAIVVCVVAVVVFLLSRRTVGLVGLMAATVVSCGAIQFLYRDWVTAQPGLPATIVALLGVGMLFMYQCYKQSIYSANRVKRTSFLGAFSFAALMGVVCLLVGAGVFYGVVAAADLTTPEIKPFEEYVSPPVDPDANSYDNSDVPNDETSDDTDDEEEDTSDNAGGNDQNTGSFDGMLSNSFIGGIARAVTGYNPDATDQNDDTQAQAYLTLQIARIIFALLLIAIIVAIICLWRYRRTLRLKRIAGRSPAYQVWFLYDFFLGRFARLRIKKPDNLTPLEFAVGYERAMTGFTRDTGGVDFVEITTLYEDATYGGYQPTDAELERVRAYYRAFFKNARIHVGWPKWLLWKFWRI